MYGRADKDPLVKYYDETVGLSGKAELEWYLAKIDQYGGPVLDLACGTGRIALLAAKQGYNVVCIDNSEGMLTLFKKKLLKESVAIQKKIVILNGLMSHFNLHQQFGTIICVDAFFHNITVEEQIACLVCVKNHLNPEGRFVFNIPNPNCEFLLKCADSNNTFHERKTYTLANGNHIRVEEAQKINFLEQTITTQLRYTVINKKEHCCEESWWKTRYVFLYEAVHLLHRCGLEVESMVGDYENGPITTKSQLIFQAKAQKSCQI